VGPRAVIAE